MRRFHLITLLVLMILFAAALYPVGTARAASSISASDLISLVNGMRTANGLPALKVNSILMGTAQSTAATMAANASCTHLGDVRGRVAAAGYGGGSTVFATENIACGGYMTISDIQSVWSDYWHMLPMTEASYQDIGAGVYTSGGTTYYVVHAAYTSGGSSGSSGSSSSTNTTSSISQYMYAVITSTPQSDGAISHVVEYGQALSSIAVAYGVTVDQIKELNGLTSNSIYVGQVLIIRKAPTPTVSPTRTPTVMRPTRTTTATPMPTTPSPTRTPTPTVAPGPLDGLAKIDRPTIGLGMIIVSGIGLLVIVISGFIKKKPGA